MGSDLKLLEDVVLGALLKSSGGLTVHQIRDRAASNLTSHELTDLLIDMRQNTFLFFWFTKQVSPCPPARDSGMIAHNPNQEHEP